MRELLLFILALACAAMPCHSQSPQSVPASTDSTPQATAGATKYADPPMSEPIRYINPSKPAAGMPQYPGQRYEVLAPATLDLAAKLMRKNMRDQYFGPNGEFMAEGHFHAHVNQILSSLEVAEATGDRELLDRSLKAYEYGKSRGQALVGFFPEHVRQNEADHTSETCQVGDMVMAAIMLSNLGIDRWDDADRWIRNEDPSIMNQHVASIAVALFVAAMPVVAQTAVAEAPALSQADRDAKPLLDRVHLIDLKKGEFDKGMVSGPLNYIKPNAPEVRITMPAGSYYDDRVPNTIDLAEIVTVAINALTAETFPEMDYEAYFNAGFTRRPVTLNRDFCDNIEPYWFRSLLLARTMTGSQQNFHVEQAWVNKLVKSIGPDGLYYWPYKGRPWLLEPGFVLQAYGPIITATGVEKDPAKVDHVAFGQTSGNILQVLNALHQRDGNPRWLQIADRMIARLGELLIKKDDYGFFPGTMFGVNARIPPEGRVNQALPFNDLIIDGAVRHYQTTGSQAALELATRLANYEFSHFDFDENGKWLRAPLHMYEHAMTLYAMSVYATTVNDARILNWVVRGFEEGKTYGDVTTGFFPEQVLPEYPTSESAAVAAMLATATQLSASGVADYWDDVDRWTRNRAAATQLIDLDWLASLPEVPAQPSLSLTTDRAAQRVVGGWPGWSAPNDWTGSLMTENPRGYPLTSGMMPACVAEMARALYLVWDRMLEQRGDELTVHCLMNRASEEVDVYSHIPYQGTVEIKARHDLGKLRLRIPEWVRGVDPMECRINGSAVPFDIERRYVVLRQVKAGDEVTFTFPITTRAVKKRIGESEYTMEIKGSTVISIDPPGKYYPLYRRSHFRETETRFRGIRRFVPQDAIQW